VARQIVEVTKSDDFWVVAALSPKITRFVNAGEDGLPKRVGALLLLLLLLLDDDPPPFDCRVVVC
jgi:hypothetical protein